MWGWGLIVIGVVGIGAVTPDEDDVDIADAAPAADVVDTVRRPDEPAPDSSATSAEAGAATTRPPSTTTTSSTTVTTVTSSTNPTTSTTTSIIPTPTTSARPTTAEPVPSTLPPVVDAAGDALRGLRVAEPDPARPPYIRDEYDGDGWADTDGDCLSTRHELLVARSLIEPTLDGCRVTSGRWIDPYTAGELSTADQATIDHLVPLAEAHRSGAWRWDGASKNRFSNDETPGHLQIVSGSVNQSKSDSTPDEWLPPDPASHCQYAIDWITTKSRYGLSVTSSEGAALERALGTCGSATDVRSEAFAPPVDVVVTTPTTTTTTTIAPSAGPGVVALLRCERYSEEVEIGNTGGSAITLSGHVLFDEGNKHDVGLGRFGELQPGQRLTILSGPDAVPGPGRVVWTRQNVWNNDGDVATLIAPGGTSTTTAC